MVFGSVSINRRKGVVRTHRGWYLLRPSTVIAVHRPLLPGGLLFGTGFCGFAVMFADLLWPAEIALILAAAMGALAVGLRMGRLSLLSRDLRGSEFSTLVWGTVGALNVLGAQIEAAMPSSAEGDSA